MIPKDTRAWAWVPTLYFTQGIPYVLVVTVSVILYKNLGIDVRHTTVRDLQGRPQYLVDNDKYAFLPELA